MSGPPKLPKKGSTRFKIVKWTGENEGEKGIVYGISGIGKTSLCALLPGAVFIGADDGGRKIRHPITDEPLNYIPGINNFADVRAAITQPGLFKPGQTAVIDTITEVERWALPHLFQTVAKNQSGNVVKNIEDYGYHKGYRRWHDMMRLILSDCDQLIRQGVNVFMIAQSTICKHVQAGSDDFVKEGPELHHDKNVSTMNQFISWADHVLRIANCSVTVDKKGKASGTTERAVYVHPEPHFHAKSRTIPADPYAVVSFENKTDDSIWKVLFGDE